MMSGDAWRRLAETEIKASAGSLDWRTPEGLTIKPLYTADDLRDIQHVDSDPGFAPFVRGPRARRCTPGGHGRSANTPASRPRSSRTLFTGRRSPGGSRGYRSLSISPRTAVTTRITLASWATWAKRVWRSTRSRT